MTKIEWTKGDDGVEGKTWNPSTGCDRVSPGCDNCYALTMAKRLKRMGAAKYQNDGDSRTSGPGFGISEHPETLDAPFRWQRPRKVFVNSMSDLFHSGVSDDFIARVWAVMALTPQHTYQILTKRNGRMKSLLSNPGFQNDVDNLVAKDNDEIFRRHLVNWPLPNVWLGVSVEDQSRAHLRIPALLDTPAAVRFLSCEPLLSPVDLAPWLGNRGLGWVICGGESGPGARLMDPAWARSIVEQGAAAEVPVFVKQLGTVWAASGKGGDMSLWPPELRVRQWPRLRVELELESGLKPELESPVAR